MVKLNRAEKVLLANNALVDGAQRLFEAPKLDRLAGRARGGRALELGCGRGYGVKLILERFGADDVVAIDLDPDQIALAGPRVRRYGDRATVRVGNMRAIDEPDASFDAVFAFQVVHHTTWTRTVAEVARVLVPGGRFYFIEPTRRLLSAWPMRSMFDHPADGLFDPDEFVAGVEEAGMAVGDRHDVSFFGSYVAGVGRKGPQAVDSRPERARAGAGSDRSGSGLS